MAKLQNKTKDNPKLEQRPLKDGRISLYLEYYLGRTETPLVAARQHALRKGESRHSPSFYLLPLLRIA